jgi:SAM-dependent methyltransferase
MTKLCLLLGFSLASCCWAFLPTLATEKRHLVSCLASSNKNQEDAFVSRRDLLSATATFATAAMALSSSPLSAKAASEAATAAADITSTPLPSVSFGSKWSAVDGLNRLADSKLVGFDMSAYQAMKNDPSRTPLFQQAIQERLGVNPETQTVLDLGTGPFALFAIMAAECGAGKVYAMEASPDAAAAARAFVKKTGYDDIITILEGYSDQVELPNNDKVDFVIAEIVGSIASEEGAYATIRDAHRFVKFPQQDSSWIPSRIQTYAAPASYTLHNLFGPPTFDWDKLNGEPIRFNCRDKGLGLLSDPVLIEDIVFSQIGSSGATNKQRRNTPNDFTFTVSAERIDDNYAGFFDEFRKGDKSSPADAERYATMTSHSLSGIACWPLLTLNDNISIQSRSFPNGGYQKSHWQTVLPIGASRPIGNIKGGDQIQITTDFQLGNTVVETPTYSIQGVVQYS